MNIEHPGYKAANGNDARGDAFAASVERHGPQSTVLTWTVDLGGPVQVSSVLYLARFGCCTPNRNRLTEIRVGSQPARFDDQHSARCVRLEGPFVAPGYARLFRCAVPLTGRYVRLSRDSQVVLDFAELAVFGNRLREG